MGRRTHRASGLTQPVRGVTYRVSGVTKTGHISLSFSLGRPMITG